MWVCTLHLHAEKSQMENLTPASWPKLAPCVLVCVFVYICLLPTWRFLISVGAKWCLGLPITLQMMMEAGEESKECIGMDRRGSRRERQWGWGMVGDLVRGLLLLTCCAGSFGSIMTRTIRARSTGLKRMDRGSQAHSGCLWSWENYWQNKVSETFHPFIGMCEISCIDTGYEL